MSSFVCGLIGKGIQGSRSIALHEREAEAQGLRHFTAMRDPGGRTA
jgi:shikimate 5-dehydrogenase